MDKEPKEIKDKPTEEVHEDASHVSRLPVFPQRLIGLLADEVVKTMYARLPSLNPKTVRKKKLVKKNKKIEHALFLDTSAIIDGRIFDVIATGILDDTFVLLESILLELKHIADSQDTVRRERGRKGLDLLAKLKKMKGVKVLVLPEENIKAGKNLEVDERLIKSAKQHKARLITCDNNLEKKASIEGVLAINVNALANTLKISAVPGEAVHIKVQHPGKDSTQGVGYLDDGTMIVVENGRDVIGEEMDVVVSRVIQTATGRILFSKKI